MIVYQIDGKEREQLRAVLLELAMKQAAYLNVLNFIAKREGLDLAQVRFDQNELAFVEKKED